MLHNLIFLLWQVYLHKYVFLLLNVMQLLKRIVFLSKTFSSEMNLRKQLSFTTNHYFLAVIDRTVADETLRIAYLREINSQGNDPSHVTSCQHSQGQQTNGDEIIHSALLGAPTTTGLQIFSGFRGFLTACSDSKRTRGTSQFFRAPYQQMCPRSTFLLNVPGNGPLFLFLFLLILAPERTFSNLRPPSP